MMITTMARITLAAAQRRAPGVAAQASVALGRSVVVPV
jgi:hypothetical protein